MAPITPEARPASPQPDDATAPSSPGTLKQFKVADAPAQQKLTVKPANMSIADFYRHHGYKTLVHCCIHWQNAVSILKTGELATLGSHKNQLPGMSCDEVKDGFVYFRADSREQSGDSSLAHSNGMHRGEGNLEQITFVHDLAVLDSYPMYTGSRYGHPTPDSFSTVFFLPLPCPLSKKVTDREILVLNRVSNRSLTAIWVHPSRRDEFLAKFKQDGVDTVDGLPLGDFINPDQPLPSRLPPNFRSPLLKANDILVGNRASAGSGIQVC